MQEGKVYRVNEYGEGIMAGTVRLHGYLWILGEEKRPGVFVCVSIATGFHDVWYADELEEVE